MSTRRGNVVFMDDLLEEAHAQASAVVRELRPEYDDEKVAKIAEAVGTAAVRFNIIKVSPEKGFHVPLGGSAGFRSGFCSVHHVRSYACLFHLKACWFTSYISSPMSIGGIDARRIGRVVTAAVYAQ